MYKHLKGTRTTHNTKYYSAVNNFVSTRRLTDAQCAHKIELYYSYDSHQLASASQLD